MVEAPSARPGRAHRRPARRGGAACLRCSADAHVGLVGRCAESSAWFAVERPAEPPAPPGRCSRRSTRRSRDARRLGGDPRLARTTPARQLHDLDAELAGCAGHPCRSSATRPARASSTSRAERGHRRCSTALEARLDAGEAARHRGRARGAQRRAASRCVTRLWAIRHDRLRRARAVADLAGAGASRVGAGGVHVGADWRCRPSTGSRSGAATPPACTSSCGTTASTSTTRRSATGSPPRAADPLFGSGSVRARATPLAFVYKAAAEIGELGDNTRRLRAAIRDDGLLHDAARRRHRASTQVLGPHPVGQRRDHLRGQRPPPHRVRRPQTRRPLRRRGAERRRRQLRRPHGRSTTFVSRPRSRPTPRSSPRS